MKKRCLSFHYSTLWIFCQALAVFLCLFASGVARAEEDGGIPNTKLEAVAANCSDIKDSLRKLQRTDSVVRTHLGPYYNTILEKFLKPLNLRLVSNNMSHTKLLDNQNSFAGSQEMFRVDYSTYQRALEDLIAIDCTKEASRFYRQLEDVREKRHAVNSDALTMRKQVQEQTQMVKDLRGSLTNGDAK